MIVSDIFKDKSYYVFGLGRTGKAVTNSLMKSGALVTVWDNNPGNINIMSEKCSKTPPNETDWANIDFLVLSPGVPIIGDNKNEVVTYAEDHGVEIISDFDLLYQACPDAQYVGITGTNGKSTTTALLGHVLKNSGIKAQIGGNIGIPVMELDMTDSSGIFVLEASSYQLDITKHLKFNIAAIINITPDHLDRHLTFENYLNAKKRIFSGAKHTISSIDYPELENCSNIKFSKSKDADYSLLNGILKDDNTSFDFQDLKFLPGEHNAENILTAFIICKKLGVSTEIIEKHIKAFQGLPHRMELVLEKDGIKFINDSKATNADAAEKALKCFENIYWIVGGKSKVDGITPLVPLMHKVKRAYLIGESQDAFATIFESANCSYQKVGTIENALKQIKDDNITSGVVLLSPACASFDQFKDFEARGNAFKKLVL